MTAGVALATIVACSQPYSAAADAPPGEELPPFYIAVRRTHLTNETAKIIGYDLDGVCTCETRPATAHLGAPSCISSKPGCDLDGGVDNAVSLLAAQLSPFFSLDALPQRLIDKGRRTLRDGILSLQLQGSLLLPFNDSSVLAPQRRSGDGHAHTSRRGVAFPALAGAVREPPVDSNPCVAGSNGQPADAGPNPPYRCN